MLETSLLLSLRVPLDAVRTLSHLATDLGVVGAGVNNPRLQIFMHGIHFRSHSLAGGLRIRSHLPDIWVGRY